MRHQLVCMIQDMRIVRLVANKRAEEKDLIIIGGGPAGYVAAIKAGQAGLKVQLTTLCYVSLVH